MWRLLTKLLVKLRTQPTHKPDDLIFERSRFVDLPTQYTNINEYLVSRADEHREQFGKPTLLE